MVAAVFIAIWMSALWVLSVIKRDVSIVDAGWGPGFVGAAWATYALGEPADPRALLLVALVSIWGLRLGAYLLWRAWGQEEDFRYQAMRRRYGPRFVWLSAFIVFGLQGALMWIISLPLQVGQRGPGGLWWLDAVGVAIWAVGMLFESVGDWQLARFKANPDNAGRVMDRGLWRYTRHPNYFGDFAVWWGLWLVAAGAHWGWATLVSPLLMSFLLMRVSGVPMLERGMQRRKSDYADYVRRTASFFPRPPTGSPD